MTSARPRLQVPDALRRNAVQVWGETGRAWLDALPDHLGACSRHWGLTVGEPFELSHHWVAPARTSSGDAVVIKLGVPGHPHLAREADVLRRWDGHGAVRLLGSDPEHGALLVRRARPGTPATELVPARDEEATRAVLAVARSLHEADPGGLGLPDVATEAASMQAHLARHGDRDPLPPGMVEQAREMLLDLTRTRRSVVLLHGDLHHDNVLRHADDHQETAGWVAIDPHGWCGDPGFEVGPLLYNPLTTPPEELRRLLRRRLEVAVQVLGEPPDRLRAWGFVAAVLSQVWSCEDGGAPEPGPGAVAEALRPR